MKQIVPPNSQGGSFPRAAVLVGLCCALSAGCAVVHINPDATNSIVYNGDESVGKDYAMRACRKGRQKNVEVLSIVNKDDSLPPGKGRQVITFKCSSEPPKPQEMR